MKRLFPIFTLVFAVLCFAVLSFSVFEMARLDRVGADSQKTLDMSHRGLSQIPQTIFTQTDLVELDLSGNRLVGSLPAEIRFLNQLEVLNLSDNVMTGLPAEIGQLRRLQTLNLSHNQLTGLPSELAHLTSLRVLDLRGNPYSKFDLDLIRSALQQTTIWLISCRWFCA